MLSNKAKELFDKLGMGLPAIAIKYLPVPPEGVKQSEEKVAFCQFLKYAQLSDEPFYVTVENDTCYGKLPLGMIKKEDTPVTASGRPGKDFEVYKTEAACRKLYKELPIIEPGTIKAVLFSKVSQCDFDPDLILAVAELEKAEIIMRATTYISGDLWESKSSPVLSCSWMYAYPMISGKVNHITTGFYHGVRRRKTFQPGLRMISIPYNKIDEVVQALDEMPWTTIAFRDDEESKEELSKRMKEWQEIAKTMDATCDIESQ